MLDRHREVMRHNLSTGMKILHSGSHSALDAPSYASLSCPCACVRAIPAHTPQMNDTGIAAKPHSVLNTQCPGRRFVVFCREGDGPDRDITEAIGFSEKDQFPRTGYAPSVVATANDAAICGSAEFLRVEVCIGGGGGGGGHHTAARDAVSLWAVGRTSLRVEARSFDGDLGEDRQVAAGTAFMASWAFTMQVGTRRRRKWARLDLFLFLASGVQHVLRRVDRLKEET